MTRLALILFAVPIVYVATDRVVAAIEADAYEAGLIEGRRRWADKADLWDTSAALTQHRANEVFQQIADDVARRADN